METEMKFEDCSLWHHLIFVEELVNDANAKALCSLCSKRASGPVYKCLDCNFLQHQSCGFSLWGIWNKFTHWMTERHHLIFREKEDNNDEKEVCMGCNEPASDQVYKCSIPGCTFVLHESCTQLSYMIQHPLHQEHMLTLQPPSSFQCHACLKYRKSLHYSCEPCHFDLEIGCLPLWQITADDCPEHALIPCLKRDQFTCEACGEESKGTAYLCSICRLMFENGCHDFPHTILTTIHENYLTCTYFVHRVKKQDRVFCRLCRRKVNTRYGAYYCKKCGYIVHLKCGKNREDKDATMELGNCNEYAPYLVYLVEGSKIAEADRVGPQEIQSFIHPQHELILRHEESRHDKRCEACMQFIIFPPFYKCTKCDCFLHIRCAKVPQIIKRGIFHEHLLTLVEMNGMTRCDGCHRFREGFFYKCDKCPSYRLDVQCCLVPEALEHIFHPQHTLFLAETLDETCDGCGEKKVNYVCVEDCEFKLCMNCITLPFVVKYRYHPHLLTPTSMYDDEENYCLICEKTRYPAERLYWCEKCDFTVHLQCILGDCLKFEGCHPHPLAFAGNMEGPSTCDACDRPLRVPYQDRTWWQTFFGDGSITLTCSQCDFFIHHTCRAEMFTEKSQEK